MSSPPIYGDNFSAPQIYLPPIEGTYIDPRLSEMGRRAIEQKREEQIDKAIKYLTTLVGATPLKKKASWITCCDNSIWNLGVYLMTRPISLIKRVFCCCFMGNGMCANSKERTKKSISQEAFRTLENTRVQFERNTCGVCCIAPIVIITTPFIPGVGAVGQVLLAIFSSLVITTTAGTNTYVFSGDIGVVPDGQGDLIVEGGIRVNAIATIKNDYDLMAERLKQKWESLTPTNNDHLHEREVIYNDCTQIRNNWDTIIYEMVDCGIKKSVAENALAPFAKIIAQISYSYEKKAHQAHKEENKLLLTTRIRNQEIAIIEMNHAQ